MGEEQNRLSCDPTGYCRLDEVPTATVLVTMIRMQHQAAALKATRLCRSKWRPRAYPYRRRVRPSELLCEHPLQDRPGCR